MSNAPMRELVMRVVQRLDEETRDLRSSFDDEVAALLGTSDQGDYQRYLTRAFGFIAPLERSLLDTPGLTPFMDTRRLRKRMLIEHDLLTLGLKVIDVHAIPQCMWIPWFDDPLTALGWAYIIERSTLGFPTLFRHLANVLPGEAAFAATYLKTYGAVTSEMWKSFADGLDTAAAATPENVDGIIAGASDAFGHFHRWRNVLDGKHASARTGS